VSNTANGLAFQSMTRAEARLTIDTRIRNLRRNGQSIEAQDLQAMMQKNFPG
jgi:PII interaction protein X